jgi:hypothetical protein
MFVTSISVRRDGYFGSMYGKPDPSQPFVATIEVHGEHGKVELKLSPELSQRVVEIISDEVAAAGRATAEAMVAAVIATQAVRSIEDNSGGGKDGRGQSGPEMGG